MPRRRVLEGWVGTGLVIAATASAGHTRADAGAKDDGALAPLLESLATCDGKRLTEDCAARDAWKKHVAARDAESADTEAGKADRRRHAVTCLERLAHASASVREAAALCLAGVASHAPDRKEAARAVIARYRVDRSVDARHGLLEALRELNPTEHGLASDVLALARPAVGNTLARGELGDLLRALEPTVYGPGSPLPPEAIAFATELVRRGEVVRDAVRLFERAPTLPPETCAALLAIAETKRGAWAEAVEVIGKKEVRCKESRERAMQIVVEVATRPAGPSRKLWLGEASPSLVSMIRGDGLAVAERTRWREAVKAAEAVDGRAALEPLRDALGAK